MNRMITQPLGDVCVAKSGNSKIIKGTLPTKNDGTLFPAYSATGQDVFSEGYDFDEDGIVISAVGARCGKCFLASGKWRAIANTHVILPKPDKANVRFLWYLLNDESFWVKGGAAQPFVKIQDSLRKPIAVPSLAEQERIANLLDEADGLRKLRTQAHRRTATLIPAIFHEMFSNPESNPGGWPKLVIGDILEVSKDRIEPLEHPDRIFNYIGLENIEGSTGQLLPYQPTLGIEIKSTKNVFHTNQILYGKLRPYLNKVYLAHEEGICSTDIYVLHPNQQRVHPEFIAHYLQSPAVLAMASNMMTGASLPRISQDSILKIPVYLPPLALQQEFVVRVSKIRAIQVEQSASRSRLKDLFQSILHRAFKGEL